MLWTLAACGGGAGNGQASDATIRLASSTTQQLPARDRPGNQASCANTRTAYRYFDVVRQGEVTQQQSARFFELLRVVGVAAFAAEDPNLAKLGKATAGGFLMPLLDACDEIGL